MAVRGHITETELCGYVLPIRYSNNQYQRNQNTWPTTPKIKYNLHAAHQHSSRPLNVTGLLLVHDAVNMHHYSSKCLFWANQKKSENPILTWRCNYVEKRPLFLLSLNFFLAMFLEKDSTNWRFAVQGHCLVH